MYTNCAISYTISVYEIRYRNISELQNDNLRFKAEHPKDSSTMISFYIARMN